MPTLEALFLLWIPPSLHLLELSEELRSLLVGDCPLLPAPRFGDGPIWIFTYWLYSKATSEAWRLCLFAIDADVLLFLPECLLELLLAVGAGPKCLLLGP